MNTLTRDIKECLVTVGSCKVIERKKGTGQLRDYLMRSEVIYILNSHSRNQSEYLSWDMVFQCSHKALLNELERINLENKKQNRRTSTAALEMSKNNFVALVMDVVKKANADVPYLKCRTVVESVLQMMEHKYYKELVAENYINLLYQWILPNQKYWPEMYEYWEDLYANLVSIYSESKFSRSNKLLIVNTLASIVKYGCSHSTLALIIKKNCFDFIALVIKDAVNENFTFRSDVLSFSLIVCNQLKKECRLAICRFGELNLQPILNLYEEGLSRKKTILFELLLMIIELHHPYGVENDSSLSYAYQWNEWRIGLRKMYSMIDKEICALQKFAKMQELNHIFLQFVVAVFKQIFSCNFEYANSSLILNNTAVLTDISTCKRKKNVIGFQDIVDNLKENTKPEECFPWLQVLAELLSSYPSMLKENDYIILLKFFSESLSSFKEELILNYTCRCCISLINIRELVPMSEINIVLENTMLKNIWDITLRSVGLNQNIRYNHKLLRSIPLVLTPSSRTVILKLFLSESVFLSKYSLKTLYYLSRSHAFPNKLSQISVWKTLLDWLVPCKEQTETKLADWDYLLELPTDLLAHTLILITGKNKVFHTTIAKNIDKRRDEADKFYFFTSLKLNSMNDDVKNQKSVEDSTDECKPFVVNEEALNYLLCIIQNSGKMLLNLCLQTSDETAVQYLAHKIVLIFHIFKYAEIYRIILNGRMNEFIVGLIQKFVVITENTTKDKYCTASIKILKQFRYILDNVSRLPLSVSRIALYQSNCFQAVEIIKESVFKQISEIQNMKETENAVQNTENLDFHLVAIDAPLDDRENFIAEGIGVLIQFCYHEEEVSEDQNTFLKCVLDQINNLHLDYSREYIFKMLSDSVSTVSKIKNLSEDTLLAVTTTIKNLCAEEEWYKIEGSAIVILELIQTVGTKAFELESKPIQRYLIRLMCGVGLNIMTDKHSYGPKVVSQFIRCAGFFDAKDRKFLQSCIDTLEKDDPDVKRLHLSGENMFSYLANPFNEVRFTVVNYIPQIFESFDQQICHAETDTSDFFPLLQKFLSTVYDTFVVHNMSDGEKEDEILNRPTSVLYSMAYVICRSVRARRPMLDILIRFARDKNIDSDLIWRVFLLIKDYLQFNDVSEFLRDNVFYILWCWYEEFKTFQTFPWRYFNCNTETEFQEQFLTYTVPVLIMYTDETELKRISALLGRDVKNIIENCFPEIMALILPQLSNGCNGFGSIPKPQIIYSFLVNHIGDDRVRELCTSSLLSDVIVSIISTLQDYYLLTPGYHVFPTPNQIFYNKEQVCKAIEDLQNFTSDENKSIMCLCDVRLDCLQKVFLQLYINIRQSSTVEIRLQRFQMYALFCELILTYLKGNKNNVSVKFVIRTVLHNALSLISSNCELTSVASLTFLTEFLIDCLPIDDHVINKYVSFIIGKVVPFMRENTILGKKCVSLLNSLLVDNFEHFSALTILYPFPDSPPFDQISPELQRSQDSEINLNGKIERFLNGNIYSLHPLCHLHGLKRLRKQLSSNKKELTCMFQDVRNIRGFFEDHSDCILHKLIRALMELTQNSDNEVKLAAVCCLGEIGLVDFHTYVLHPVSICKKNDQPVLEFTREIIQLLIDYIIEDDIQVLRAASNALYAILASAEGIELSRKQCLESDFIYPFISIKDKIANSLMDYFDIDRFTKFVAKDNLWTPDTDVAYEVWLTNLTCALLDSFKTNDYITCVKFLCKLKISFMEHILPHLFNLLLSNGNDAVKQILVRGMNSFFRKHFEECQSLNQANKSEHTSSQDSERFNIYRSKSSVQCLLRIIQLLYWKYKLYLNVLDFNFLHMSRAAQYCSSYFTSLFYVELWVNQQIKCQGISHNGSLSEAVETICTAYPQDRNTLLFVLREAYSKLGDIDALHGYGASNLVDSDSRISYYEQMGNWQHVMESCNLKLLYQPCHYNVSKMFASSLGHAGLNTLQNIYLNSVPNLNSELQDVMYESSWRLSKWDTIEPSHNESSFSYYHYSVLRNVREKSNEEALYNITLARKSLIPLITGISLEAMKNIYPFLSKLQCLQEIEDFVMSENVEHVYTKWRMGDETNRCLNFDYLEPIYSQRINILKDNELASKFCLEITNIARNDENYHYAGLCLTHLKNMSNLPDAINCKLKLEEAQLLWDIKDSFTARLLLEDYLKSTDNMKTPLSQRSTVMRIYGCWLLEKNLESVDAVFDTYFLPSMELLKNQEKEDNITEQQIRLSSYKCVSEFADDRYQCISRYVDSHEFAVIVKNANEPKESAMRSVDARGDCYMQNQKKLDNVEIDLIKGKRMKYLNLAMTYYLKTLRESDDQEMCAFRLISLWLENKTEQNILKKVFLLHNIPTYKFIAVLPQIVPHIKKDAKNDITAAVFNPLIERCAIDHPHHTLPLLLALANFYKDETYCSSGIQQNHGPETRYFAAQHIINKLKCNQKLTVVIKQMEYLADAYISLAYYERSKPNVECPIPSSQNITKLRDFTDLYCPTITIPVSKICDYSNTVGIHKFKKTCSIPGGMNAPKRITCVCSDGKLRMQLVKGKEDLRQDAVMQQVFTNLNKLLMEDKHTSKRNLIIRTYKIVPLSQRSGVIEFCENTTPLGTYLIGGRATHTGAHRRYRPSDLTPEEARYKMNHVSAQPDSKLLVYNQICSRLQPVFRYFFFERFPSPTMWFERKLAYIHSLATSSIIGYILGLGDRHLQNILIDEGTAELIHIDFGVAFDQGLLLRTPELVPFRLTRDIEDGMGVFGIDGIFRRCCEKTLQVLRRNKNIIKTTIEVFLYDPLYLWIVTPEKAAAVQRSNKLDNYASTVGAANQGFNKVAERALTRIRLKLEGLEEGSATSIEGQVNRLIQQAKDPQNLCKIFCGWQPYL